MLYVALTSLLQCELSLHCEEKTCFGLSSRTGSEIPEENESGQKVCSERWLQETQAPNVKCISPEQVVIMSANCGFIDTW